MQQCAGVRNKSSPHELKGELSLSLCSEEPWRGAVAWRGVLRRRGSVVPHVQELQHSHIPLSGRVRLTGAFWGCRFVHRGDWLGAAGRVNQPGCSYELKRRHAPHHSQDGGGGARVGCLHELRYVERSHKSKRLSAIQAISKGIGHSRDVAIVATVVVRPLWWWP